MAESKSASAPEQDSEPAPFSAPEQVARQQAINNQPPESAAPNSEQRDAEIAEKIALTDENSFSTFIGKNPEIKENSQMALKIADGYLGRYGIANIDTAQIFVVDELSGNRLAYTKGDGNAILIHRRVFEQNPNEIAETYFHESCHVAGLDEGPTMAIVEHSFPRGNQEHAEHAAEVASFWKLAEIINPDREKALKIIIPKLLKGERESLCEMLLKKSFKAQGFSLWKIWYLNRNPHKAEKYLQNGKSFADVANEVDELFRSAFPAAARDEEFAESGSFGGNEPEPPPAEAVSADLFAELDQEGLTPPESPNPGAEIIDLVQKKTKKTSSQFPRIERAEEQPPQRLAA